MHRPEPPPFRLWTRKADQEVYTLVVTEACSLLLNCLWGLRTDQRSVQQHFGMLQGTRAEWQPPLVTRFLDR